MASVRSYSRGGFRVTCYLRLPSGPVQRHRHVQAKSEANLLRRQLEQLEEAIRIGAARVPDIQEWLRRKWLTAEEAADAFRTFRDDPVLGRTPAPVDFAAILRAYEQYALAHSKARDATRKTHANHLSQARQVLAWLAEAHPRLDLSATDVQRWLAKLDAQGYTEWSVHHYLQRLRLLLDQAQQLGMLETNLARSQKRPQPRRHEVRRLLTDDEAHLLLELSLGYRELISGCLPTVVYLGLYAELRPEEMCWLTWACVDRGRRLIHVQETVAPHGERWRPKDAEARTLDVKQGLIEYLATEHERLHAAGSLGPFLIPGGHRKMPQYAQRPIGSAALQKAFARMVKAERLDARITVYSLRHTYATALLRAGVDIETVRDRMGHSDIRTTQQYLRALRPESHPTDRLPW